MTTSSPDPVLPVHRGSGHCGHLRSTVRLDATRGTRCNCTICSRLGWTGAIVRPDAFTLACDEASLDTYSRHPEIDQRYFCPRCHIGVYGRGHLAQLGGDFVSINLNCLDDVELAAVEIGVRVPSLGRPLPPSTAPRA